MGKAIKAVKEFIDGIPDSKLETLPTKAGTIHSNNDLRLDMQGVSSSSYHTPPRLLPSDRPALRTDDNGQA